MVALRNGRRVSLQVGGQGMHDFFSDRRVDPLSHHEYSFSGMRLFAVASARRRLTINHSVYLRHKFLEDHGGIVAAESKCI